MPEREERHFAGKVNAINAGLARVAELPYGVIASLDADITFESDYFSFLLEHLAADQTLGVVGTPYAEESGTTYDYRFVSDKHVSGACQVFRRKCFEAIGGYLPLKGGAIDSVAVIMARMKGWKTRTFTDRVSLHHREIGTAQCSPIQSRFCLGVRDYAIGNHPVWEMFRVAYQMTKSPYAIRGLALGAGYLLALVRHKDRQVPHELVAFHRQEQMQRLKKALTFRVCRRAD